MSVPSCIPLRSPTRPLVRLMVVLLALPLLAGCLAPTDAMVDGDTASQADANSSAPPANGTVFVQVVSTDGTPLQDARVVVRDRTGTTGADGTTRITELAPGFAPVRVEKSGYRTGQSGIEVVAGGEVRLEVKLLRAPADASPSTPMAGNGTAFAPSDADNGTVGPQVYQETYHLRGRYECSLTYLIITGDCMVLLDFLVDETGAPVPVRPGDLTEEDNILEFPVDAGWRTIIAEMAWEADATSGTHMTFNVEPTEAPLDGHAARYARVNGESPLLIRLEPGLPHPTATASADGDEPDLPNPAGGEVLRTRSFVQGHLHNPGGTNFLGFGAAINQQFEVFATVFYGEPAPEGWTIAAA